MWHKYHRDGQFDESIRHLAEDEMKTVWGLTKGVIQRYTSWKHYLKSSAGNLMQNRFDTIMSMYSFADVSVLTSLLISVQSSCVSGVNMNTFLLLQAPSLDQPCMANWANWANGSNS